MKERPILFSAPMVRALLDDRKTQTRRIVNPQPVNGWTFGVDPQFGKITSSHRHKGKFGAIIRRGIGTDFPEADIVPCKYGQPGDQLWVKETWRTASNYDDLSPTNIPEFHKSQFNVRYLADTDPDLSGRTRVSIHMPRWASRITLEVASVRVERLQDISNSDIRAEGAADHGCTTHLLNYQTLWESINGPGSWDQNPWVWVLTFKRI